MIDKVREKVLSYVNKDVCFRYNGSRNQVQEFYGKITKCYKQVFVIETLDFNRSFTYTDVLIGVLEIDV